MPHSFSDNLATSPYIPDLLPFWRSNLMPKAIFWNLQAILYSTPIIPSNIKTRENEIIPKLILPWENIIWVLLFPNRIEISSLPLVPFHCLHTLRLVIRFALFFIGAKAVGWATCPKCEAYSPTWYLFVGPLLWECPHLIQRHAMFYIASNEPLSERGQKNQIETKGRNHHTEDKSKFFLNTLMGLLGSVLTWFKY